MNKAEFISSVKDASTKIFTKAKLNSPEILLVVGIGGAIVATVAACKASTHLEETIDEAKNIVDDIHTKNDNARIDDDGEMYSEKEYKKDLVRAYSHVCWLFIKLYGTSAIIGAFSISSLLASNHIMRERNVALAAAYTAVDTAFKGYRARVAEKYGAEEEENLYYDIHEKEYKKTETDAKGKEKTTTEKVSISNITPNDYMAIFDETSEFYEKDSDYNRMFLGAREKMANDRLRSQGVLFLNEVYDMLGMKRTDIGQIVGWVYDKDNPKGDNYVDLGLKEIYRDRVDDFMQGYERAVVLNPNVDGVIIDKLVRKLK